MSTGTLHTADREAVLSRTAHIELVTGAAKSALEYAFGHVALVDASLTEQARRDEVPDQDECELLARLEEYEAAERAAQAGKSAVLAELAARVPPR